MTKLAISLLAIVLIAVQVAAQSAAELLQKGIYAQETSGDLDAAIQIYRQIMGGAYPQRDIVAQAQFRLAQALLKKGDAAGAAEELKRLARDNPNWQPPAGAAQPRATGQFPPPPTQPPPVFSPDLQVDLGKPITVQGVVSMVVWANPRAALFLQQNDETGATVNWGFELGSPKAMLKLGWTRASLRTGETVTVTGFLAANGVIQSACPGPNAAAICSNAKLGTVTSILRSDGTTLAGPNPSAP